MVACRSGYGTGFSQRRTGESVLRVRRSGPRPRIATEQYMADTFTIAAVQMRMAPDKETNLAEGRGRHRRRREAGGARSSACRSCSPGYYFCQKEDAALFDLAEPIPGPSTERLAAAAKKNGVVVVGSLFEQRMAGRVPQHRHGPRRRRRAARPVPQDAHPGRPAVPREVLLHARRPRLQGVRPRQPAKVGTLVCWDQWYPEAARLTALQGAEVIFYPTAIGWHPKEKAEYGEAQHSAWETSMRGHAIANGTYVAAVNRVGHEVIVGEGLEFWGGSFVSDPFGRILKQAAHRQGRDPGREVRPEADGGRAAELAVLPRPPHRCVRRHHEARGGLTVFTLARLAGRGWRHSPPGEGQRFRDEASPLTPPRRLGDSPRLRGARVNRSHRSGSQITRSLLMLSRFLSLSPCSPSPPTAFAADWKPAADPAHDQVGQGGHARERVAGIPAAAAGPQGLAEPQRPVGLRHHARRTPPSRRSGTGKILVPFCVESALSGVGKTVDEGPEPLVSPDVRGARPGGRASASCCTSARSTGRRRSASTARSSARTSGGYDPFTFDITDALKDGAERARRRASGTRPTPAASRAASR